MVKNPESTNAGDDLFIEQLNATIATIIDHDTHTRDNNTIVPTDFAITCADVPTFSFSYIQQYSMEYGYKLIYVRRIDYVHEFNTMVYNKSKMFKSLFFVFFINSSSRILIFSFINIFRSNVV